MNFIRQSECSNVPCWLSFPWTVRSTPQENVSDVRNPTHMWVQSRSGSFALIHCDEQRRLQKNNNIIQSSNWSVAAHHHPLITVHHSTSHHILTLPITIILPSHASHTSPVSVVGTHHHHQLKRQKSSEYSHTVTNTHPTQTCLCTKVCQSFSQNNTGDCVWLEPGDQEPPHPPTWELAPGSSYWGLPLVIAMWFMGCWGVLMGNVEMWCDDPGDSDDWWWPIHFPLTSVIVTGWWNVSPTVWV